MDFPAGQDKNFLPGRMRTFQRQDKNFLPGRIRLFERTKLGLFDGEDSLDW